MFDVTDNLTVSASLIAYIKERIELSFTGTIKKSSGGRVMLSAVLPTAVLGTCVALLLGLV